MKLKLKAMAIMHFNFQTILIGNISEKFFPPGICYSFPSATILLALPVSCGYQTQSEYYTEFPQTEL